MSALPTGTVTFLFTDIQGSTKLWEDYSDAMQTQPDFAVTNANAPALASICHRLDGIPLAIELAAAPARSLSIEDIHSKLDQRFRLLTGGSRTALPRQQTLRSLIDWSYDLLNEPEKALLCRLSVFAWGLDAGSSGGRLRRRRGGRMGGSGLSHVAV